jgi:hypothetical protein
MASSVGEQTVAMELNPIHLGFEALNSGLLLGIFYQLGRIASVISDHDRRITKLES